MSQVALAGGVNLDRVAREVLDIAIEDLGFVSLPQADHMMLWQIPPLTSPP